MENSNSLRADNFLRQRAVAKLCGLSRTTIWRLEREGLFPARKRLSKRAVGWLASEVAVWLESRAHVNSARFEDGAQPQVRRVAVPTAAES